jgi:hypothetical protein
MSRIPEKPAGTMIQVMAESFEQAINPLQKI